MTQAYAAGPGGIWIQPGLVSLLTGVDTLVFDIDGVLVDTTGSYPEVASRVVQMYFSRMLRWPGEEVLLQPAECALFKAAGGFNNDWELAAGAVLFYLAKAARIGAVALDGLRKAPPALPEFTAAAGAAGGGLESVRRLALAGLPAPLADGVLADFDRGLIERLGQEVYGGADGCETLFGFAPRHVREPGLFNLERPLLDADLLAQTGAKVGIYTGRTWRESQFVLPANGLDGRVSPETFCGSDSPFHKPDPGGLRHLGARLGTRSGVFCGDNIDDVRTVIAYRQAAGPDAPPFWFAGILGGVLGERSEVVFRSLGADIIAPDVNAVVRLFLPLEG